MEQKYIKDNDGNKILPITSVTAVRNDKGQTLAAKIEELELKSDGNNNLIKTEESRAKNAESSLHSSVVSTNNALNTERSERTAAEAQLRAELNAKQYEAEAIELDAVPTKDSTKMVNSGAIYTALQDMVYDVSVKHPASGVDSGNTYTLSGALSVIPAADRKAGMSIKFIQSSDNKYVQHRCIADEFTTDVTKWQGVDDELTAGSDNLAKSGSVYGATHPVMSQFKYIDLYKYPRALGNINSSTKKWTNVTNVNRVHFIIPVEDLGGVGAEFYMEKDANVSSSWAFLSDYNVVQDGDASVISKGYVNSHDGNKWVIPENAVYLYLIDFPDTHNIIDRLWLPNILDAINTIDTEPSKTSNNVAKSGGIYPTHNAVQNVFLPFKDKNISIIGDSISTYKGFVPDGYGYYYPRQGSDVTSEYDMWWHLVLSLSHSTLGVNASFYGSCVTNVRGNEYPTLYDRANILGTPDYIFVALGTNDSVYNSPLTGVYNYTSSIQDLSVSTFESAYIKGIKALIDNYPNAQIILVCLAMNNNYFNAINNIGEHYNLKVVDAREYYIDNVHPDKKGQASIAKNIVSAFTCDVDTVPILWHKAKAVSSDSVARIKAIVDEHCRKIFLDDYVEVAGNASSLSNPANSIWTNVTGDVRHVAIPIGDIGNVGDKIYVVSLSGTQMLGFLSQYAIEDVVQGEPSYLMVGYNKNVAYNTYTIPDGASHLYVLTVDGNGVRIPYSIYSKNDILENTEDIDVLQSLVDINIESITLLYGNNIVIDNGTTYNKNNKPTSNRVGAVYPIEHINNSFKVNITNITLDEGSTVRIALLNNKAFISAYIVKTLKSNIVSDLEDYIITIDDAYKDTAKYLGIYIYNSTAEDTTQCFDAEVEIIGDTKAKDIIELQEDINALDTKVDAVETALDNLETNGDKGGDDCLYEKKTIQTTTPYYLQKVENPVSYEDGYYLENKVKAVPKDGRSFIFITDTHIEVPDSSENYPGSRNARHSDLLLSYIKKRCGLSTGIFGGDCIDYDSTNYRAAQVLSEYASEFFGVFGENGLWAHGNHDCNSAAHNSGGIPENIALISDEEVYNRTVKTIENKVVFDIAGLTTLETVLAAADFTYAKWWWKMHYFKDVPELKTRFIVLESGDNSYGAKLFKSYSGVKWMQFDFVANALNTIPEGYDAVITCHQCGKFTTVGAMDKVPDLATYDLAFMKLLSTYKMKGTYTVDINNFSDTNTAVVNYWIARGGTSSTSRTFDMSEHQGSGRVLFITGHFHNDITLVCQTVNNSFGVARVCEHAKTDVEEFDDTKPYSIGDEVVYNDTIYAAGNNMSAGSFDSSKWLPLLDKDNLEDDAVFLLWRNRDAYSGRYKVSGSKEYAADYMTLGTITEQSFDVFSFLEDKIKITKIGAGEDIELPL